MHACTLHIALLFSIIHMASLAHHFSVYIQCKYNKMIHGTSLRHLLHCHDCCNSSATSYSCSEANSMPRVVGLTIDLCLKLFDLNDFDLLQAS